MKLTAGRILIIDPDATFRREFAALLKRENYDVETGSGIPEALKKISDHEFDCLIMDVNLPEMKGYEVVPILKNMNANLKIIITTKKNTKKLEIKVREQDIYYYFIKSFGKDELIMAINNVFNP